MAPSLGESEFLRWEYCGQIASIMRVTKIPPLSIAKGFMKRKMANGESY